MAGKGNSQRRGAVKKSGKGNPTAGSGGRRRRGLEGKGPTPRAKDRPGHKAHRQAKAADRSQARRPPRRASEPTTEWVVGRNPVVEALRESVPVTTMYVAEQAERDDRMREAFSIAADRRISLLEVPRPELDRLTGGLSHQGLALKVPPYDYAHPDDLPRRAEELGEKPLIVVLDGITDPRNLGAVVRSAAAFGAHGVVVPARRAAGMTASAWKTSAGAAARVPVARATNLSRQLKAYQAEGLVVAGLAAEGASPLADFDQAADGVVLVVGSEGKGLARLVREHCDVLLAIPMTHDTESLNAGVAAGVALYEIARQR
ncbi:MAG: 23S rRNA (guanosine(2251)-2'-O)-methyltransferase RlmB [Propionibacteriales bacterium]|nr:23S rRNA (guanosine(2251)-2'-O)-methyltransferase RlmB [Propionibacteriales bacterium]